MMELKSSDFEIQRLGECMIPSPMPAAQFVGDDERVLYHGTLEEIQGFLGSGQQPPAFEMAGPRQRIFFHPSKLKSGIVTCGGLCPGLNDVIRSIVLGLYHHYGVRTVFGFPYGYEGLTYRHGHEPIELTPDLVAEIQEKGGTILGSSRGPQDVGEMVDTLERMNVGMLFAVGGDGTLRGAGAIVQEVGRRNLTISVIGVPKTIDNDISCVDMSFGFVTAVSEARGSIYAAHAEALGARNGVGLVKLMGRESGFISAYASLSTNHVNFCLVPKVRFTLDAFLRALDDRLKHRGHAVVVVAEGAEQNEFQYRQVSYDHEPVFAAGSMLGVTNAGGVHNLLEEMERQGLDVMSAGVALAWATEAFECGIVTDKETVVPLRGASPGVSCFSGTLSSR